MKSIVAVLFALTVSQSFAAEPRGSQTPREAFDKFGAAIRKKDYGGAMVQITPDSQGALLGMLSMGIAVTSSVDPKVGAEGDAILTKHNVKKFDMSKFMTPPNDRRAAAREVSANVKDKTAALVELLVFAEKNSSVNGMPALMNKGLLIDMANGELTDLKVDGNGAVASVKVKTEKSEESQPIKFEKANGVWLIDILP